MFGSGLAAAFIGGVAWLLPLKFTYKISWVKAFFVALVIWLLALVISSILPTVKGPL